MVDLFIDLVALFLYFFIYLSIYISLFSFCECVCVCFFGRFCQYRFPFTIFPRVLSVHFFKYSFSACYQWWMFLLVSCSLIFLITFLCFYLNNFKIFFILITLFIFPFFLFFSFLPFLLSHVTDSVLVLQSGVRPVPLSWEIRVQDIGPETSQPVVISISESSP